LTVALAAAGPLVFARSVENAVPRLPPSLELPRAAPSWGGPGAPTQSWHLPAAPGLHRAAGSYASDGGAVDIELLVCCSGLGDRELIGHFAALVDPNVWQTLLTRESAAPAGAGNIRGVETVLRSRGEQRVVWRWYVVGGEPFVSDWRAKVAEASVLLRRQPPSSTLVILSAAAAEASVARARLFDFMRHNGEYVVSCVEGGACLPALR
jgi:EpsI family protein